MLIKPNNFEPLMPSVSTISRYQGLGVCLDAIRVVRGSTIASVTYPADADEGERLMYPAVEDRSVAVTSG